MATNAWYDEIKDYNWKIPGFSVKTGHFTQVVWKNSLEIGIGVGLGENNSVVVCANYFPAGNMMGAFEENVLKKSSNPISKENTNSNNKQIPVEKSSCCTLF